MKTPDILQDHPEQRANSARGVFSWPLRASLALLVLSTLAHPRPGHSQTENASASEPASNTLILPGSMPVEEVYQQMIISYSDVSEINTASQETGTGLDLIYLFTDSLGRNRKWQIEIGTNGIPPNNPNHFTDTIFDSINGAEPTPFQPNEALYPSDTNRLVVYGAVVDSSTNKGYMAVGIEKNSTGGGRGFPYIEMILDANNVTDYTKRSLTPTTGLPQGGTLGNTFSSLTLKSDSNGKYLEVGIKQSIDKTEDGIYRIRLNSSGITSGVWVKAEVMSRRAFLVIVGSSFSGK